MVMKQLCFLVCAISIFYIGCKSKSDYDNGNMITIRHNDSGVLIDSAFIDIESVQLIYLQDSLGLIGEVDRLM